MRWRLLAAFVGITVMILAAQDVPLATHLRRVETQGLVAQLERDAFILAGTAAAALSSPAESNTAALRASVELYRAEKGAQVVVTDGAGIAVVGSDQAGSAGADYSNRPEIASALSGAPASGRRNSRTLNDDLVYVAVPVLDGTDIIGAVRLSFPAGVVDARAGAKVRGLVVVGLISLVAAALAALFMSGTITRPLRRLQRATERLATGDFQTRAVADEGPKEVRVLGASFNTMTERIARLVDQQRAFAADASHQLRTPLTALRLQLERGAALIDSSPVRARQHIEAAGAETERLQHLIQALLLLARPTAADVERTVVDVAEVVRERTEIWRPLAVERGLELHVGPLAPARASAAPGVLEQIIDNYLDNAINIAPPGSLIEVVLRAGQRAVEVHVLDRGPGMAENQLAHAFDRFWRAADAPHEGTGLGLAIVAHLAQSSGATVTLSNRPEGGLDAEVTLSGAE